MSRYIHGDGTTSSAHINQAEAGITLYDQVHADDDHVQEQDNRVQLLAMEELVPISQTLITPALARLFNLEAPSTDHNEQLLRPLPEERSLVHPHHEQHLKHVTIHAAGEKEDVQVSAEDRPQHAADSLQMMMMMGTFMEHPARGPAATHLQNRPHVDASLIHSYIDPNDSIDDCAEGFGTNHVADRENSSNSGDGGAGSAGGGAGGSGSGSGGARTLKRPRLVWTPQLHKRFVDAVSHLGIKNAVPKTIMQLMNVEGLTRENVASHLQKYRLYLRRVQQGNLFSSCNGATGPSSRSILSPAGQLVEHHHQQLNGGAPLSPGAASTDHQLFSSSFPALQAALQDQYTSSPNHQHRSASTASNSINPLIRGHSLLLHQAHQQLKPAAKAPPFTQQHLNSHLYNAITVDISPAKRRSPWLSPQASMDMSSPHHVGSPLDRAASSSKASSPPKRALTLFPH